MKNTNPFFSIQKKMAYEIDDIGKFCGKDGGTAPGIETSIEIINECDVVSIPAPTPYSSTKDGVTIETQITWEDNKRPVVWNFRIVDAQYSCVIEGDEDAEERMVTVTFFIPQITPQKTYQLDNASYGRHIIFFKDRKEGALPRIIGEKGNGAKVVYQEQTNPKNGYAVTITCKMKKAPFWYDV